MNGSLHYALLCFVEYPFPDKGTDVPYLSIQSFIDIEDKGGYLNIIDEDGIITTLMGEEREKFLFCLSTYKHIFHKI